MIEHFFSTRWKEIQEYTIVNEMMARVRDRELRLRFNVSSALSALTSNVISESEFWFETCYDWSRLIFGEVMHAWLFFTTRLGHAGQWIRNKLCRIQVFGGQGVDQCLPSAPHSDGGVANAVFVFMLFVHYISVCAVFGYDSEGESIVIYISSGKGRV